MKATDKSKLTIAQQNKIISAILSQEPYKTEYNNNYHRLMVRKMLTQAMVLALEEYAPSQDEDSAT